MPTANNAPNAQSHERIATTGPAIVKFAAVAVLPERTSTIGRANVGYALYVAPATEGAALMIGMDVSA